MSIIAQCEEHRTLIHENSGSNPPLQAVPNIGFVPYLYGGPVRPDLAVDISGYVCMTSLRVLISVLLLASQRSRSV